MKLLEGAIELEQCEWPGNIGDQCADTLRLHRAMRKLHQKSLLTEAEWQLFRKINPNQFRTSVGLLRSLKAPFKGQLDLNGVPIKDSWREDDTSGDQYLPWYLEATLEQQVEMRSRIIRNFFRYGNNQIIHPGMATELMNWDWAKTQVLNSQVDLFEFKWRWDDEHNTFRENENSSADYLNYSVHACDRPEWLRSRTKADLLISKWESYWEKEPNKDWYLEIIIKFLRAHYD